MIPETQWDLARQIGSLHQLLRNTEHGPRVRRMAEHARNLLYTHIPSYAALAHDMTPFEAEFLLLRYERRIDRALGFSHRESELYGIADELELRSDR